MMNSVFYFTQWRMLEIGMGDQNGEKPPWDWWEEIQRLGKIIFSLIVGVIFLAVWGISTRALNQVLHGLELNNIDEFSLGVLLWFFALSTLAVVLKYILDDFLQMFIEIFAGIINALLKCYELVIEGQLKFRELNKRLSMQGQSRELDRND